MATIIKPPAPLQDGYSVFLAGSIELGTARNWQTALEEQLSGMDILIFNPRRDHWDASWLQSKRSPQFREQVEWELHAMEKANVIVMYFEPNTKSPISLLDLGLFARSGKLVVCCPEGFWRKGNVDIVCETYRVKQVNSFDDLLEYIVQTVNERGIV
jgi:hypothetical protein